MYTPPAFRLNDAQAAFDLISRDGFAALITIEGDRPVISHLPMIGDPSRRILRGHLARANPHAAILDGRRHLAVFTGANAYVSPDWYGDAEEVPTWNYSAAHVGGLGRVIDDQAAIDAILSELSGLHERRRHDLNDGKIWTIAKLPADKLRRLRNGIVAFEIAIDTIETKAKLSQNKSAGDVRSVIEKLGAGDEAQRAVAVAMAAANGGRR